MSPSEADLLYRSGKALEVEAAIRAIEPTDEEGRFRLMMLGGVARFDGGNVVEALELLHEAVEVARAKEIEHQFSAALTLFTRESEFQCPDEVLQPLSRLRQMAASIGDAASLTGLHLAVARLEACRGHCVDAHRHLEIVRGLPKRLAPAAVLCGIELVDASLGAISGNLSRAVSSARSGFEIATQAQLCLQVAGTAVNLGLMALLTGSVARARSYLEQALSLTGQLSFLRLAALDNLAQLALHEGQLDACRGYISQCAGVIATQHLPARSWYDFAHQVTHCAYLERVEAWDEILRIVDDADAELARRQFRSLRTSLLCARARALAALGRHPQADAALATAIRVCPRGAADPLITWEAAKAACLSRRGQEQTATVHFDRALSAARAIGHKVKEQAIEHLRRSLVRVETAAAPRGAADTGTVSLMLGDVATILRAGHSIDILAHRLVALLEGTSLAPRAEVRSESGCTYHPDPSVSWQTAADGTFTLHLRGSDRHVSLVIRGVEALDEISLVKSLTDLVQAAVGHTGSAAIDEDDQELWPTFPTDGSDMVFRSARMAELLRVALRLAASGLPILITGETGTGKEVVARLIHDHSAVKRGPFVAFNCSALPRELVESQLFGHRRGAFTGAVDSFPGVIRSAEHGTLFLDEIGDLEAGVQPKLLRFLESAEVHPVGEPRPHKVSVRIVAATNADLDRLAEEGRLRSDLYYRLNVARIALPALRERKDEIPALASLFVTRFGRELGRTGLTLGDDLMAALLLYDWPGNIRQLANELRRIVAMADSGDTLRSAGLSPDITRRLRDTHLASPDDGAGALKVRLDQPLDRAVEEVERAFITRALGAAGGRVAEAAHLLGISRKGLFLKRRRWGLVG